jgi:PAS domain S-box-containing protein
MNYPKQKVQLVVHYAAAVASIGIATWIRELADPLLGERVPFLTYFLAVVFLAWYAGLGPALFSTALGSLAALYFFIPPSNSLIPDHSSGWAAWVLFVFVGSATALLSQSRRWALDRVVLQQDTIREEAVRFSVTLMSIGDGVIMVDTAGQVTFMNSVAEQLTGWKLADALRRPVEDIYRTIHDRTRRAAENPARQVLKLQAAVALPNFPVLQSLEGRELPVNDHAVPMFAEDGSLRGAVLLFRDDTHRRKARKALRASESRFRTLADSAPVLIWMADRQRRITFVNQPWLEFTGKSQKDELGTLWESEIYQDDLGRCVEIFQNAFELKRDFQLEYRMRRADGELRWLLDHGIPLYGSDDEFTGYIGSRVDVTRQREAADALRESEERFRALADNAPAAIFIKDLHGRYVVANPLSCQVLGRNDILGTTDHDLLPRDVADRLRQHDQQVIQSGEPLESEEEIYDGAARLMFLSVKFPLHNAQGEIDGVCGVAFDITDRKQTEEALRESEETFHRMSDSIPQLAWMALPDGHIFWYNQRWYDYTGSTPEQMIGWGWQAVHDPEHLPRVMNSYKESIANGVPWEDTFPLRRHDGAMRWHLSRALPVRNKAGEIVRWFGTNTDITDRKQIESTLRFLAEASESLSALVDYKQTLRRIAQQAVPTFADWCEVAVVEGERVEYIAVAPIESEEPPHTSELSECKLPQPTDDFGMGAIFQSQRSQLLTEISSEMRQELARDEKHREFLEQRSLSSMINLPISVHGQMLGVLCFSRSDAERPFTPDDLAMAEDLAHRAGIAIENARLYQELREADRRKDDFLAMLAHELRNPLVPIRTGLDLLSMLPNADGKLVGSMQKQVEHLVRLVDDLLDVSRIMRGKVDLRPQKVVLRELIEQVLHAAGPLARQQKHELVTSLTEEEIWLHADPVRIIQVIENLLTNACKYTDPNGRIELSIGREDNQAIISVRDNGNGIDPELLPKVFDLFTQSARTLDRSQGGLGIGLTLVRTLVEMHGGSVSVRSEGTGQGSEFVVRLPTCAPGAKVVEQRAAPDIPRRVLLVDDNRVAADMLRLLLTQLGPHQAETVYSGERVLEKVESFQPEIILLDIGLPGKNGYEVAREIREIAAHDKILLVALTGYGQLEDRQKSKQAGFDEHLVKPPAMEEIRKLFTHPKLAEVMPPPHQDIQSEANIEPDQRVAEIASRQERFTSEDASDSEASPSLREIVHDLGNTVHVVSMAARILEQSSDPSDHQAVQRMLNASREAMMGNLQSLKEHVTGKVRHPR